MTIEDTYLEIHREIVRKPRLPELTTNYEKVCVVARLEEVLAIFRVAKIAPLTVTVSCAPNLAEKIGPIMAISGIQINVNSCSNRSDKSDCGTFIIDILTLNGSASMMTMAVGIAYPEWVAEDHHDMRWTLQVIDGMTPERAKESTPRLL